MSINLSTIRKENLIAVHTSGTTIAPVQVLVLQGSERVEYKFERDWSLQDNGTWTIKVNGRFNVLNDLGVSLPDFLILGTFTVNNPVTGSQYLYSIDWNTILDYVYSPYVFTKIEGITIGNGAKVCINSTGIIKLWDAKPGEYFTVIDPLERLKNQSNVVQALLTQTIGVGQFKSGITPTNELDLSAEGSAYFGGGFKFIMDTTGKNWVIECVKAIDSEILTEIETLKTTLANLADNAQFTALTNRVVTLEDLYHESDSEPNFDLKDWRFWHNLHRDGTTVTSKLYYRAVKFNDVILMNESEYSVPLTPNLAVEIEPGHFKLDMGNSTTIDYKTARTEQIMQLSFRSGVYISAEWYYTDVNKAVIRTGYRTETIQPTDQVKGMGIVTPPSNAVFLYMKLTRTDNTFITYEFPLST